MEGGKYKIETGSRYGLSGVFTSKQASWRNSGYWGASLNRLGKKKLLKIRGRIKLSVV